MTGEHTSRALADPHPHLIHSHVQPSHLPAQEVGSLDLAFESDHI